MKNSGYIFVYVYVFLKVYSNKYNKRDKYKNVKAYFF